MWFVMKWKYGVVLHKVNVVFSEFTINKKTWRFFWYIRFVTVIEIELVIVEPCYYIIDDRSTSSFRNEFFSSRVQPYHVGLIRLNLVRSNFSFGNSTKPYITRRRISIVNFIISTLFFGAAVIWGGIYSSRVRSRKCGSVCVNRCGGAVCKKCTDITSCRRSSVD